MEGHPKAMGQKTHWKCGCLARWGSPVVVPLALVYPGRRLAAMTKVLFVDLELEDDCASFWRGVKAKRL